MIISLGNRLLDSSSSLPGSRWRAGPARRAAKRVAAPAAHAPCLTLLPVGFTEPDRSPGLLVSSYLAVSPLPRGPEPARRFAFCCTFPGLAAGGRYPSLRPAEPGLSSRRVQSDPAGDHPTDSRQVKHKRPSASGEGATYHFIPREVQLAAGLGQHQREHGRVEAILHAGRNDRNPNRKRGTQLPSSLTLRVSMARRKTSHFRPHEVYKATCRWR